MFVVADGELRRYETGSPSYAFTNEQPVRYVMEALSRSPLFYARGSDRLQSSSPAEHRFNGLAAYTVLAPTSARPLPSWLP
jgi:hypothetical protein